MTIWPDKAKKVLFGGKSISRAKAVQYIRAVREDTKPRRFARNTLLQDDSGFFSRFLRYDGKHQILAKPLKGHPLSYCATVGYSEDRVAIVKEGLQ